MDVYIRDVNGNTLAHVRDVLDAELFSVAAHLTEAGNVMVTVLAYEDTRDEEEIEAERMTADDMRAAPEWGL